MSGFWYGYLAGLITTFLPSLIYVAVAIRKAPELSEAEAPIATGVRRDAGQGGEP